MNPGKIARSLLALVTESGTRRFWWTVIVFIVCTRLTAIFVLGDFNNPQLYETGTIARNLTAGYGYSLVFHVLQTDLGIREGFASPRSTPTAFTMPGYVFVMYVVLRAFGDNGTGYLVLYLLNLCMALLSVYLVYRLSLALFGERIARWTAVLSALYPPFIAVATTFGGTLWYQAALCGVLVLVLRIPSVPKPGMAAVIAGLAMAVFVLFRAEGLALTFLYALWLWKKTSLRTALVFALVVYTLATPWLVRNYLTFHRFVPMTTNGWLNFWRGNNPSATGGSFKPEGGNNWYDDDMYKTILQLPLIPTHEIDVLNVYKERALLFVREHPLAAAGLYCKKLAIFFTIDYTDARARSPIFFLSQILLVLSAVLGLRVLMKRGQLPFFLLSCIIFYALLVSALHIETRYQIFLSIIYMCFSAVWFEKITGKYVHPSSSPATT